MHLESIDGQENNEILETYFTVQYNQTWTFVVGSLSMHVGAERNTIKPICVCVLSKKNFCSCCCKNHANTLITKTHQSKPVLTSIGPHKLILLLLYLLPCDKMTFLIKCCFIWTSYPIVFVTRWRGGRELK